jgi:hypothetical protein
VVDVTEDIDVVRALDLGGLNRRPGRSLRRGGAGNEQAEQGEDGALHDFSPWVERLMLLQTAQGGLYSSLL